MKMTSVFVALALFACSKAKEQDPDEVAKGQVVVEQAKGDLKKLTDKLANGTVSLMDCVVTVYLDDLAKVDADLAGKLRRLCTRDVQVFLLERQVPKAEADRAAKPDAITLEGCDSDVGLAIDQLDEYGTNDEKSRALIARYDAACPLIAKARASRRARKAAP
jgi:hypothetical protein